MSPRTRSLLALGGTLLLGLALGILLGSRLAIQRFDRLERMAYPPHLLDLLHEDLQLDASQEVLVDSLLKSQASAIGQRMREHRLYMRGQMDSLLHSLKPHLSEEQWQRLKKGLARPPRGRGPGWGPHPDRGRHGRGWRGRGQEADSLGPPPPPGLSGE
jgi:hypothetical protein